MLVSGYFYLGRTQSSQHGQSSKHVVDFLKMHGNLILALTCYIIRGENESE